MTGVQPSFLLMLLIPPTLGLVHQLKFILEQPFVICALDNRARLARNLLAALLFIAFRAVMAVEEQFYSIAPAGYQELYPNESFLPDRGSSAVFDWLHDCGYAKAR